MNIKLSSLATRSTRPTGGKGSQVRDAMQAAGITFRPLAVETLEGWTERSGSRPGTKRYPWCAGGVLEPCHGLQVSGHSTPAVSSVLICPPPAAWLPASHLACIVWRDGTCPPLAYRTQLHIGRPSRYHAAHHWPVLGSDGAPQPCQHFI